MGLYCLKHKVYAYRNHNPDCTMRDIIPITKEMRPVADRLYDLGFEVMSASGFSHQVQGSLYEHRITVEVEFKIRYWNSILGELPTRWRYYTETSSLDHWPISILSYCEIYLWFGFESVEERIKQIITELVSYLDTRDRVALRAIMLLSDS